MKRHRSISALVLLAFSATAPAWPEIRAIELGVETRASAVVLPSSPPSSLVVTPCSGCKPLLVPTSARSQYFIDQERVELAELKRVVAAHPDIMMVIIYDRKTGELRRLRVFMRSVAPRT